MNQRERRSRVERLSDREIIEHAKRLANAEWEAQLELFFHIGEIERRRLHLEQGCSSVFDYLVRRLGYSEPSGTAALRHVPAPLRDRVWVREGGRCTYVGENGVRCSATRGLEIHHDEPLGMGGRTMLSNLRLACRPHNLRMAEECYGAVGAPAIPGLRPSPGGFAPSASPRAVLAPGGASVPPGPPLGASGAQAIETARGRRSRAVRT